MSKMTPEKLDGLKAKNQQASSGWIKVGMNTCGVAAGAKKTMKALEYLIFNEGLKIKLEQCGCSGQCYAEPLVEVCVDGVEPVIYKEVTEEVATEIFEKHIKGKQVVKEHVLDNESQAKQVKIVLRNCGVIDPENVLDYIAVDGYQGIKNILAGKSQADVIEQMKMSGLRGRGGGGFQTWMKWSFANKVDADQKYIICNADEGDPGAYMDRSVLEGDPHSVLEGMMIAGFAVGADKGFLYIRAEYPLAIERVRKAIAQLHEVGLLGKNILGSKFSFDFEIRYGAGAFVCGEETALIASIEGKRGCPTPRPPYPSIKGLWGKPTVINNVETLANIPVIFTKGAEYFSGIGTETSKGTKVFAVTGKVANPGLVEVPMGTSLREIVFGISGGVANGKKIKAIQTGGPSGGGIPERFFDTPVDYENLQKLGSIMGSGGMIIMDEDDCMVDIAKFYLQFCVDESCGKCAPCRLGGTQMLGLLEKMTKGNGEVEDVEKLKKIATAMQKASLCGLGQTAPNPVLSGLEYFNEEFLDHINHKKCLSGTCQDLSLFTIIEDKCVKCSMCQKICPADAIEGNRDQGYKIIQDKCIKCGQCFDVCKFSAIAR